MGLFFKKRRRCAWPTGAAKWTDRETARAAGFRRPMQDLVINPLTRRT